MIEITSKRILLAGGLGKSGRAAAKLFLDLKARVIFSDSDAEAPLPQEFADAASQSRLTDVRPREDVGLLSDFEVDLIVAAPGVPLSNPVFSAAREKRIPVYGENDFAAGLLETHWKRQPWIIAVTGTDGKSTTTALTAHLIGACAKENTALPCGNFGTPLSSLVLLPEDKRPSVLVVECSSFQLEPAHFMRADCAMILNLSQDHLDRYAALSEYLAAKLKITTNQKESDVFLAPASILLENTGRARRISIESLDYVRQDGVYFPSGPAGKLLCAISDFRLPGAHNLSNLNCALFALENYAGRRGLSVDADRLSGLVREFKGLSHRMEVAAEKEGILYINDSKATTVQAVLSGLTAFAGKRVALLAGGFDKGLVYSELAGKADFIFPFGQAGPKIQADTGGSAHFETLEQALAAAVKALRASGGVVYLGPACASYDAYNSYEERGRHFCELVNALPGAAV